MNARQNLFIKAYIACGNGAEAARQAGYSEKTARTIADRLLTKTDIRAAVNEGLAKLADKFDVTAESVIARINHIADNGAAERDKLKALELLGKYLKIFTEVTQSTVEAKVSVNADEVASMIKKVQGKY